MAEDLGKLSFCRNDPLAVTGHYGTVFKGKFEQAMDVSISRILKREFSVNLDVLRKSQNHPNILRYYCNEQDADFMYIAKENCAGTLKDFIRGDYSGADIGSHSSILRQITSGLEHLHQKKIVHCDLKPANVQISFPDGTVGPLMKLTNFGMLRIAKDGNPVPLWKLAGSKSWMAPEVYLHKQFTFEMDLFSLGCLFGYDLTNGIHPYGQSKEERIVRIKNGKAMILTREQLKNVVDAAGVLELIGSMLNVNPSQRPSASEVLTHPFLSSQTCNTFYTSGFANQPGNCVNPMLGGIKIEQTDDDDIIILSPPRKKSASYDSSIQVAQLSVPSNLTQPDKDLSLPSGQNLEPLDPSSITLKTQAAVELDALPLSQLKVEKIPTVFQGKIAAEPIVIDLIDISDEEEEALNTPEANVSKSLEKPLHQDTEATLTPLSDPVMQLGPIETSEKESQSIPTSRQPRDISHEKKTNPKKKTDKGKRPTDDANQSHMHNQFGGYHRNDDRLNRPQKKSSSRPRTLKQSQSVENKELNRDFRRQTAAVMEKYAAFIATHLEIGMQVRYCRHGQVKHPLLRLGDIGAVVKINGKNVHIKWEHRPDPLWVSCSNIEILPDERNRHHSSEQYPVQNYSSENAHFPDFHQQQRLSLPAPNLMDIDLRPLFNQPQSLWPQVDVNMVPSYCSIPEMVGPRLAHGKPPEYQQQQPQPQEQPSNNKTSNELDLSFFMSDKFVTNGTFLPGCNRSLPQQPSSGDVNSNSIPSITEPREWMKRVNFPSSIDYAAYVNSRITVGMLVRSSPGAIDFEESDTGTVRRIYRGGIHDVQVKWKRIGTRWNSYEQIEILSSAPPASSSTGKQAAANNSKKQTQLTEPIQVGPPSNDQPRQMPQKPHIRPLTEEQWKSKMAKNERKREAKKQRMLQETEKGKVGRFLPPKPLVSSRSRKNVHSSNPRPQTRADQAGTGTVQSMPHNVPSVFSRLGGKLQRPKNDYNNNLNHVTRRPRKTADSYYHETAPGNYVTNRRGGSGSTSDNNSRHSHHSTQPRERSPVPSSSQSPLIQVTFTNSSALARISSTERINYPLSQPTQVPIPEMDAEMMFDGVVLHDDEF